jgi:hypothetical protein
MAVIVNMIGFDPTYPINCQVSPISSPMSTLFLYSTYNPQVWVTFELVSTYNVLPRVCPSPCLGLCLPCCRLCHTIGCASYVRLPCIAIISLKQADVCCQDCYLEQKQNCCYGRNGYMGDQPLIPLPQQVLLADISEIGSLIKFYFYFYPRYHAG